MIDDQIQVDELRLILRDVIQDFMELEKLIAEDEGGRMLKLVNEKFQAVVFKVEKSLNHPDSLLTKNEVI